MKSSERVKRHISEKYEKTQCQGNDKHFTDNIKVITHKTGRYNKEMLTEDLHETSKYLVADNYKHKQSRSCRHEDENLNLETSFVNKRSYETCEDTYNYKSIKKLKKNKSKENERIACILQGKETECVKDTGSMDNTSDLEIESEKNIPGDEIGQRLRLKKLLKAAKEIETLERQKNINSHLEKNWKHAETQDDRYCSTSDTINGTEEMNYEDNVIDKLPCNEDKPQDMEMLNCNLLEPDFHKEEKNLTSSHADNMVYIDSQVSETEINDLPPYYPAIEGCRSVNEFQMLNHINEGTYGVVYRAKDKQSQEIVALKRLKMEKEDEGFPVTSLREINIMLKGQHPNIVAVREIVMGSNMDKIFIVMDYIEHDLKSLIDLMRHKKQSFTAAEVKCLLKQLLSAVAHLHDNWILHRDLKTSNLLLSHNGVLKVGDFGLAREYGSPLRAYTPIVVTLWYRAPELLLGAQKYSTPIDMWSIGCIFCELVLMNPIFQGKSEIHQIFKIFKVLGTPNESIWPGYNKLPAVQKIKITKHPTLSLRSMFHMLSVRGQSLLEQLLTYDPAQRITAEDALQHSYFNEVPLAIDPAMFPKWPAKSELDYRRSCEMFPKEPKQLQGNNINENDTGFRMNVPAMENRRLPTGGGFNLKF